jgi:hypothetical protein
MRPRTGVLKTRPRQPLLERVAYDRRLHHSRAVVGETPQHLAAARHDNPA